MKRSFDEMNHLIDKYIIIMGFCGLEFMIY